MKIDEMSAIDYRKGKLHLFKLLLKGNEKKHLFVFLSVFM